jgi:hypothetical protein
MDNKLHIFFILALVECYSQCLASGRSSDQRKKSSDNRQGVMLVPGILPLSSVTVLTELHRVFSVFYNTVIQELFMEVQT